MRYSRLAGAALGLAVFSMIAPSIVGQTGSKGSDPFKAARLRMVAEDLAREGITHDRVLEAMKTVPRHLFVNPDQRARAYLDTSLPIGHKQTISPPFLVAYMTQALDPRPGHRVLEIGTGSGYQAAVLAELVKEVFSIEIVEPLGTQAAQRLQEAGYKNVKTKIGDGFQGWAEHAPFDRIIVTCSPEDIPRPLLEELREGGKLIVPLGEQFQQVFYLVEKRQGQLVRTRLLPTCFVPMTGAADAVRTARPTSAVPVLINGDFEQAGTGGPAGWYWKREPSLMQKDAPSGERFVTVHNAEPGRSSGICQNLGIDGTQLRRLEIAIQVKGEKLLPGLRPYEQPCLSLVFADVDVRPVGEAFLGPWKGTFAWQRVTKTVDVPRQARFVILRISLNGGTGSLSVDDVHVQPAPGFIPKKDP